jgi:hypothetical protein
VFGKFCSLLRLIATDPTSKEALIDVGVAPRGSARHQLRRIRALFSHRRTKGCVPINGHCQSGRNRYGKDFGMVRLRTAVLAAALSTGVMGCSFSHGSIFHCDECDDFPTPGYGPGYSMMPGTYTGPPARDSLESNRPGASAPTSGEVPTPSRTVPPQAEPSVTPPPPAVASSPGADVRRYGYSATELPRSTVTLTKPALPTLPASVSD